MKLTTKIFIGLLAGIAAGLALAGSPELVNAYIAPIGTLFLNLIKMIIVPMVFASLVVGAASTEDVRKLGRIGGKTIAFYLVTTAIAVIIGLVLANVMQPGAGFTIPTDVVVEASDIPPLAQTILNIIPANPLNALVTGNMLQIITFALFLGVGVTMVGEKGQPFLIFFDSLAEIMYKITALIMNLAPYGIFGLITPVVAANGPSVLFPLLKVILAVYIGVILHALIVYSSIVKIFGKMNPMKFFKGIAPAATVAFSTASSAGTLPVTIKSARDNLGVPNDIASFVLPLGATINMDGTALYQGICALFVAQVYGLNLSLAQQATIVLTATLASIGTAGVPSAGFLMLTMVLTSVGLPLEGSALIAGIDRILDMARTTINIVGDAAVAVAVSATEEELNIPEDKIKIIGE